MTKLAFKIRDDEGRCEIIFAASQIEAEAIAEQEGYEETIRTPQYDSFAEKGIVPASVLIPDGRCFECSECDRHTDCEEEEDFDGNPLEPVEVHYLGDRGVFCSKQCLDAYTARAERRQQRKEAAIAEFNQRFPGATVRGIFTPEDKPVSLDFRFPGSRIDASWTQGEDTILISKIDVPAYEQWRGKKFEEVRSHE